MAPPIRWRRRSELNRRIEVLQTSALPLGYAAKKRKTRFELATSTLARWSSTTELLPQQVHRLYQGNWKIVNEICTVEPTEKGKKYVFLQKLIRVGKEESFNRYSARFLFVSLITMTFSISFIAKSSVHCVVSLLTFYDSPVSSLKSSLSLRSSYFSYSFYLCNVRLFWQFQSLMSVWTLNT